MQTLRPITRSRSSRGERRRYTMLGAAIVLPAVPCAGYSERERQRGKAVIHAEGRNGDAVRPAFFGY